MASLCTFSVLYRVLSATVQHKLEENDTASACLRDIDDRQAGTFKHPKGKTAAHSKIIPLKVSSSTTDTSV